MKLEKAVEARVKPLVSSAVQKYIGIHLNELEQDVSDRLKKPLISFPVDTSKSFKEARKDFRKEFLSALLQKHLGNVSEAASVAGLKRETIHRLIKNLGIDADELREHPAKSYEQEGLVKEAIQQTVEQYKPAIHPSRFRTLYEKIPDLSRQIAKELPEEWELDIAEKEWEKRFIAQALKENNNNISQTARAIGIRFETLHRKIKAFEISV
ncbi:hypothetical protein HY486_03755 [Candidatus Woesearchaeota archaeon]|nr:hypothetical protein [Candidatus Woesearchaeota archaeon]